MLTFRKEYTTHMRYLTKRVEELKLTDLAQRAKIEELSASLAQKETSLAQMKDTVDMLNDNAKGKSVSKVVIINDMCRVYSEDV